MKWGAHFKLFEKLQSKHLKSRLGPLILIIIEKKSIKYLINGLTNFR